jgi:hypothetical protein
LHPLADRPAELALFPELAIQSRRRDLEIVRLLDQVRRVEDVSHFPTEAAAVLDAHPPWLVDRQLQYATGTVRPPLQIHEREPVIAEYGQHGLLDSEFTFVLHHTHKVKKWATPTFSRL